MASPRRTYPIDPIQVNNQNVRRVIIDSSYELKHGKTVGDERILSLVASLDGRHEAPEIRDEPFSYFVTRIERNRWQYRMVWLLERGEIYVAMVNTVREPAGKS